MATQNDEADAWEMPGEEDNFTIRRNQFFGFLEILEKSRGKW